MEIGEAFVFGGNLEGFALGQRLGSLLHILCGAAGMIGSGTLGHISCGTHGPFGSGIGH